jgi:hypothetical protein
VIEYTQPIIPTQKESWTIMLPYEMNDDDTASTFIGQLINNPQDKIWSELLNWDRIDQTHRVLVLITLSIQEQYAHKRRDLEAKLITADEYNVWRAKIALFRTKTQKYLADAKAEMKRRNIAKSEEDNSDDRLRDTLAQLVEAVLAHKEAKELDSEFDPITTPDRLLWTRLELVKLPSGDPLIDLVKRHTKTKKEATR